MNELKHTIVLALTQDDVTIVRKLLKTVAGVLHTSYTADTFYIYGNETWLLPDTVACDDLVAAHDPAAPITYTVSCASRIATGETFDVVFTHPEIVEPSNVVLALNAAAIEVALTGTETTLTVEGSMPGTAYISIQSSDFNFLPRTTTLEVYQAAQFSVESLGVIADSSESFSLVLPITHIQVSGDASDESWKPISTTSFSLTFTVPVLTKYLVIMQVAIQKINGVPRVGFDFELDGVHATPYTYGRNYQELKSHKFSNATVIAEFELEAGEHTITPLWKVTHGAALVDGRLSENSVWVIPS